MNPNPSQHNQAPLAAAESSPHYHVDKAQLTFGGRSIGDLFLRETSSGRSRNAFIPEPRFKPQRATTEKGLRLDLMASSATDAPPES